MNLIIGQHEKLPNIYALFDLGLDGEGSGVAGYCHGTGAIEGLISTEAYRVPDASSSRKTTLRGWRLDASKTAGTGNGVYGDGNHVQPNTLISRCWLRLS